MKKHLVLVIIYVSFTLILFGQNVGIGTTVPNPTALLHVDIGTSITKGLLVTGTYNVSSAVPDLGAGTRMMFYPGKAAFRVGYATGIEWDNAKVGNYSVALGYGTTASGFASSGIGEVNIASGTGSVALGYHTNANGNYSTASGYFTTASNDASTAIGSLTTASGISSIAMGDHIVASGDYSIAAGSYVSTNNHKGACFIGDSDPNNKGLRAIGANDQFAARFNGGYYFITGDAGSDIGLIVPPGGNSWAAISDVRLKEKFLPVNGEEFLKNISKINLTTWNYKGQDPRTFRHYGPMAQDFFTAFGKDEFGTIGCDTLINQQDFLGVSFIAIQALEKRTEKLTSENKKLKLKNEELGDEIAELKARLNKLEVRK